MDSRNWCVNDSRDLSWQYGRISKEVDSGARFQQCIDKHLAVQDMLGVQTKTNADAFICDCVSRSLILGQGTLT